MIMEAGWHMAYQTLEKLFYADTSSDRFAAHASRAQSRLEDESSFRTGVLLEHGELFLSVPRELSLATERVLRRERRVSALWRGLPPIALGAFIRSLIMDEVVYSNEIEGVHSTRRQVETALEAHRESRAGAHTPFAEFAHLYLSITDHPLIPACLEDIRSIYDAVVADDITIGDRLGSSLFRTGPVVIENERGKRVHEGVTPESEIKRFLQQWLDLSASEEIPELYSALLCHFLFGYIHPFYDGNGRTGRYLLALHLSSPLSQATVLSLSRIIAENKALYYKAFDSVEKPLNRAEGTQFVLSMLELISLAQERLIADLEEKQQALGQLKENVERLAEMYGERPCETLFYAAQMHLYSAFQETYQSRLAEHLGISGVTARKTLVSLCERGLLKKVSGRPPVYRLTEAGATLLFPA